MKIELIPIVIVAEFAQELAVGVKVYVVVTRLFMRGDQLPIMPFSEVLGKVKVVPSHTGSI